MSDKTKLTISSEQIEDCFRYLDELDRFIVDAKPSIGTIYRVKVRDAHGQICSILNKVKYPDGDNPLLIEFKRIVKKLKEEMGDEKVTEILRNMFSKLAD